MNSHSADPKHITYHGAVEEEESNFPPLSPISMTLNSSTITLIILAVLEFETPIDEPATFDFLRNKFITMSPRFSSIIETEKNGVQRWKKVDIRVEDHLIVPTFPYLGLQSRQEYDVQLREYMAKIGCENFPEGKPLWEIHLIKYPSLNGVRSLVFKLSHAIGDGYSYAKLLFFSFNRAGNLSLPLSIPQISLRQQNGKADGTPAGKLKRIRNYLGFITECVYNVPEVIWCLLKAAATADHPNPIRSDDTTTKVELFRPINISTMSVSLERIKQVRSIIGATVNDVVMGMISYMIHMYMVKMGHINSSSVDMNILVMVNMRVLKGYKNMEEMIKAPDLWGNHTSFISVPIPSFSSSDSVKVNPIDFIMKTKEIMSKKKSSLLIYITEQVLKFWRNIKGQKGLEELVYTGFNNSSTMISSLIGPKEQMAIGEHPINSFYYLITGVPQSLAFTSVSCMGELKLVATMEKGFIDSQVFTGCMNQAFEDIFEAALGKKYSTEKSI